MANEITVLRNSPRGGRVIVLLYYPIPVGQRITVLGSNAVATPSSGLADLEVDGARSASDVISATQKTALDAGEALYVVKSLPVADGISNENLLASIQALYSSLSASLLAEYQKQFFKTGQQFDA